MRYVALVVVCGTFGFLLGRYLFPVIFQSRLLLLILVVLLVAAVLFVRMRRSKR